MAYKTAIVLLQKVNRILNKWSSNVTNRHQDDHVGIIYKQCLARSGISEILSGMKPRVAAL